MVQPACSAATTAPDARGVAGAFLSAAASLTGAAMFVMTGFEVFVAFLQAYIFTILSTVYIKLSVEHH